MQGRVGDKPFNFSIPPPGALGYSESSRYVKIVAAMVAADQDVVEVKHEGEVLRVTTLAGLARRGQASFQRMDGSEVALKDVPGHRAAWYQRVDEVLSEREKWDAPLEGHLVNLHLNWLTRVLAHGDLPTAASQGAVEAGPQGAGMPE